MFQTIFCVQDCIYSSEVPITNRSTDIVRASRLVCRCPFKPVLKLVLHSIRRSFDLYPPYENARILEAFRRNDFDVLINIKMLTEGTDIPDVQTVFITRETKSDILLTQMIGLALRCPRMGGTEKAYIVAFIEIWKYEIKWAGYGQFLPGIADNDVSESHNLSPQVILADLVRRLAQQMDITIDNITGSFLTLLPLG